MADANLYLESANLKRCSRCELQKPFDDFRNSKNNPDYIRSQCRACRKLACREWYQRNLEAERERARNRARIYGPKQREANKKWASENPERARHHSRKKLLGRKYNMTIEEHDAMFASQGFSCAACKSPTPNSQKGWSTDHCHKTGKVRGIVCHHCNIGLGHAKDNIETMRMWISYLEKSIGTT